MEPGKLERDGRTDTSPAQCPMLSGERLSDGRRRVEVDGVFADAATHASRQRVRRFECSPTTLSPAPRRCGGISPGRPSTRLAAQARARRGPIASIRPAGSGRGLRSKASTRIALLRLVPDETSSRSRRPAAAPGVHRHGPRRFRAGRRAYASAGLAPSHAYPTTREPGCVRFDGRKRGATGDLRSSQVSALRHAGVRAVIDESGRMALFFFFPPWGGGGGKPPPPAYARLVSGGLVEAWTRRSVYNGRGNRIGRYAEVDRQPDRFAWPTHHYGRVGMSAGAWLDPVLALGAPLRVVGRMRPAT